MSLYGWLIKYSPPVNAANVKKTTYSSTHPAHRSDTINRIQHNGPNINQPKNINDITNIEKLKGYPASSILKTMQYFSEHPQERISTADQINAQARESDTPYEFYIDEMGIGHAHTPIIRTSIDKK